MDPFLNVAIYVRESRDENFSKISTLNNQIDLLKDYIKNKSQWQLYDVYADDNFTGTSFSRPELNRLIEDAEQGKIQVILLKDLSRLGRNNAKTLLFLDWAEEQNIQVITADGRYDSKSNTELAGIDTWFNERYAQDISRKIRSTLKMKIESGEYIGTAPYGYKKDRPGHLIPDPDKAVIVKEIYDFYLKGFGFSKISDYLISCKITPPKTCWSPQSVKRILTSFVYIGTTVQGTTMKQSYKSKKTIRLSEDNWTVTENTHEAIISREIFMSVQKEINERAKGQGNYKKNIPVLKNIVYCGYCGKKMYSKGPGYICSSYVKEGKTRCTRNFHYKNKLLNNIISQLKIKLSEIDFTNENIKDEIELKAKENCIRKIDLLYNDRLNGVISLEKYTELFNRENEILKKLSVNTQDNVDYKHLINKFINEDIDSVPMELLRKLIRVTVEKSIVK